jgi:hypothetical protein
MSALSLKADIDPWRHEVRFVPQADTADENHCDDPEEQTWQEI